MCAGNANVISALSVILQNFKRQVQALGQQGMSILQETPSYAFLLACQIIAARQSGSEDTLSQSAGPSLSADPSSGSMSKQSSSNAGSAMERLQLGTASPAGGSAESPGAADLAAQGPGGGVAAGSGECASAGDVSMSIGCEDQEVQAVMDLVEPSLASKVSQATLSYVGKNQATVFAFRPRLLARETRNACCMSWLGDGHDLQRRVLLYVCGALTVVCLVLPCLFLLQELHLAVSLN
jgi:hypothetical protein